jgi:hypothetical protein
LAARPAPASARDARFASAHAAVTLFVATAMNEG